MTVIAHLDHLYHHAQRRERCRFSLNVRTMTEAHVLPICRMSMRQLRRVDTITTLL
jgi:hypothetical protein